MQTYTIYFADKSLTFTSENAPEKHSKQLTVIPLSDYDTITRAKILQFFETSNNLRLILPDPKRAFDTLRREFKEVVAAGGVVRNDEGRLLLIFRNGRWDLPKGHHEEGESIEACAQREVEEETSVGGLKILCPLCTTLHAYSLRGVWELKETYWYAMQSAGAQHPTPQTEEGITRVEWFTPEEALHCARESFPTIQRVLEQFMTIYSSER